MTAKFRSRKSLHTLNLLGENRLILQPTAPIAWIGYAIIALGVLFAARNANDPNAWKGAAFVVLIGLITRFGPTTTLFDRKRGILKRRYFGTNKVYLLSQVTGVRLFPNEMSVEKRSGRAIPYMCYSLILTLDGADFGRITLAENGAADTLGNCGRTIAAFINVPFVDERFLNVQQSQRENQSALKNLQPDSRTFQELKSKLNKWNRKRNRRK